MATEKSDKRKVLDFARTDKMKGEKNESTKAKIKSCKKQQSEIQQAGFLKKTNSRKKKSFKNKL